MRQLWILTAAALTTCSCIVALPGDATAAIPNWSSSRDVSHTFDQAQSAAPVIAVNSSGAAVAAWQADAGAADPVAGVAAKDAGNPSWAAHTQVVPDGHTGQAYVGIGGRGRAVAVWSDTPAHSDRTSTHWMQRQPGGAWGVRRLVPGAEHRTVDSFSMNAAGFGVATYEDLGQLYVQVIEPDGHWRAPVRISRPMGQNYTVGTYGASALVSPAGAVTVTWTWVSGDGQSQYCWFVKRGAVRANGAVVTPTYLTKKICSYGGVDVPQLHAASSGSGITIAWLNGESHRYATTEVWNGHIWKRHNLSVPQGSYTSRVAVAMHGSRVDAFWSTENSTGATIRTSNTTGATWTAPLVLQTVKRTKSADSGPVMLTLTAAAFGTKRAVGWTAIPDGSDLYYRNVPHSTIVLTSLRNQYPGGEIYNDRSTVWTISASGGHAGLVFTTRPNGGRLEDVRVRTR